MRRSLVFLVVLSLSGVLLASCGRGDDDPVVSGGGRSSTTSSTAGDDGSSTTGGGGGTTTSAPATDLPATGATGTTRAYLKSVRIASHAGYDRVVFEFEDALPGYRVEVTNRPVTEDGSGDEVEVEGRTLLAARFENAASARLEGEKVVPVYKGPDRVDGTDKAVAEAVDAGDFEGVVTWVIGLHAEPVPPVKVTTLQSPYRVVVDVYRA